jgi:hypothetical protein
MYVCGLGIVLSKVQAPNAVKALAQVRLYGLQDKHAAHKWAW